MKLLKIFKKKKLMFEEIELVCYLENNNLNLNLNYYKKNCLKTLPKLLVEIAMLTKFL